MLYANVEVRIAMQSTNNSLLVKLAPIDTFSIQVNAIFP